MKKVTGIGGIFFKCADLNTMKEWYSTHLGIGDDEYEVLPLNGKRQIAVKKDLQHGAKWLLPQNILTLLQKNL
jgi:hypothetical protein